MSFQYKMKLHFGRPINQRGKQFREFSSEKLIRQPLPKVTEFMDIPPPNFAEVDNIRMKFFWRKPAFKFPRFEECLLGLTLTRGNGRSLNSPLDSYTSRQDEHVLVLERCKVGKITLTYLFNGDFPPQKIHSVANFCPTCVNDSTEVGSKALRMGNICDYKSLILTSFVLSLILPTTVIGNLMVKWRRRQLILCKRGQFQRHQERGRTGQIQHITFDEARGVHWTRDQTEEPVGEEEQSGEAIDPCFLIEEREKSSSTFVSGTQDDEKAEESGRKIFLAVEREDLEMRSENKKVDNGLRYSIGGRGSSSSTGSCSSSSTSLSPFPSSPCMLPPPPPTSPPPQIF